jgi:hypothetical protein
MLVKHWSLYIVVQCIMWASHFLKFVGSFHGKLLLVNCPWRTADAKIASIKCQQPLHQLLYHQKFSAKTTKICLALTLFSSWSFVPLKSSARDLHIWCRTGPGAGNEALVSWWTQGLPDIGIAGFLVCDGLSREQGWGCGRLSFGRILRRPIPGSSLRAKLASGPRIA